MRISTQWLKGLKDKDKETFKKKLAAQQKIFKVLQNILEEKIEVSIKEGRQKEKYDKASWPFYQADKIGEQRAYQEIIDLLPKKEK